MDDSMLTFLSGLALLSNRAVESLKPYIDALPLDDNRRRGLLTLISLLIGVGLAFLLQVNVFTSLPLTTPAWAGIVATGAFVGAGSNAIHWLAEVMSLLKNRAPQSTATLTQSTTTTVASTSPSIALTPDTAPVLTNAWTEAPIFGQPPAAPLGTTGAVPPADVEEVFRAFEDDEQQRLAG